VEQFAGAKTPTGGESHGPASAHADSIERQTGKRPVKASGDSECPAVLRYLFDWFLELDGQRQGHGFGSQAVTFREMQAWAALLDREPTPWEVRVLLRLDHERQRALAVKP